MNLKLTEAQVALILNARTKLGWSEDLLASKSGVSLRSIQNLEHYRHQSFHEANIHAVVLALGLSWPEFLALNPLEASPPPSL